MSPFRTAVLAITALVVAAFTLIGILEWQERDGQPAQGLQAGAGSAALGSGGTAGATQPGSRKQVLSVGRISGYTPVVTNAQGRVMYRFDQDSSRPPKTRCLDACARVWQPVLVGPDGVDVRGNGIDPQLVGSLVRPNGQEQVTLAGWALYYHVADRGAGQISGYGRDGLWWAVSPYGTSARTVPAGAATDGDLGYY